MYINLKKRYRYLYMEMTSVKNINGSHWQATIHKSSLLGTGLTWTNAKQQTS